MKILGVFLSLLILPLICHAQTVTSTTESKSVRASSEQKTAINSLNPSGAMSGAGVCQGKHPLSPQKPDPIDVGIGGKTPKNGGGTPKVGGATPKAGAPKSQPSPPAPAVSQ